MIEPRMRVVYMGLPGVVLEVHEASRYSRVRLDNGTTDWFRTELLEPEGEPEDEGTPGIWLDRAGYPWLEAGEPGSGQVFCYDGSARRRMADKWRVQPLEEAEREFGPLEPMVPSRQGPQEGDRVVFLPWDGGEAVGVPPSRMKDLGCDWDGRRDCEIAPGVRAVLLLHGNLPLPGGELKGGAYLVIRDAR